MHDTAIVIPAADLAPKSLEFLKDLLDWACFSGLYDLYPITVCFDGCKDEFVDYFLANYSFINPLIGRGNRLGFSGNTNKGLREAHKKGLNVLLVNQDTILPGTVIREIFGEGLVSPEQITLTESPPFTEEHMEKYLQINSASAMIVKTPQTKITGFCMFINKNVMDKIGYLDENYQGYDDSNVSARALLAGFPVETVNVKVQHAVSKLGAYNQNKLNLMDYLFRKQWQIPPGIPHEGYNQWIIENHTWSEDMRCE